MDQQEPIRPSYLDEYPTSGSSQIRENPKSRSKVEPLVLAGATFLIGFTVGSGRTHLLTRTGRNLVRHLGILVSDYAQLAFNEARLKMRESLETRAPDQSAS